MGTIGRKNVHGKGGVRFKAGNVDSYLSGNLF